MQRTVIVLAGSAIALWVASNIYIGGGLGKERSSIVFYVLPIVVYFVIREALRRARASG